MFDFDDDDNETTISFSYYDRTPSKTSKTTITLNDEQSYHEIVQQFVYFLNAIGYTYIGGIAVLNTEGDEMHVTDL
jgi:hypothetical protein